MFCCTSPFHLMGICSTLCGWPSPLLGILMTCIHPVAYQHHVFFSAKLSSTLLSSSPHQREELFCHTCTSLHQLLLNWMGCLPVKVTLAGIPSLQHMSCLFVPSNLVLSMHFPRAHSSLFSRLLMQILNYMVSSVGPKCCLQLVCQLYFRLLSSVL